MAHYFSDEAEKILDQEFKVLNHGFVRLVDYMGNDSRIVQSARVSYGEGTKSFREDAALIDYLLRNEHTSPFEQVVLTFHCKMPIFVARQWVRHRTARINEISGRYSVMKDEFYLPQNDTVAIQSKDNKQGRGDVLPADEAEAIIKQMAEQQQQAYKHYNTLLDQNLAKELARVNLPSSLYTEWYWQMDLSNLFHFLKLRLHPHAQKEIRDYAEVILSVTEKVAPAATASFKNHIMGGERLSLKEKDAVAKAINWDNLDLDEQALRRLKEKLGIRG